jgi:hypothetical protein
MRCYQRRAASTKTASLTVAMFKSRMTPKHFYYGFGVAGFQLSLVITCTQQAELAHVSEA